MRHTSASRLAAALAATFLAGSAVGTGTATASTTEAAVSQVKGGQAQVTKELRALEKSYKGRIGAYAIDTATGRTVGYRSGERFPLLSTFKAPVCAAALHKASTTSPGLMDKVVKWTKADLKPHSPTTEKHVEDGLTVAQLCEATITLSDNTAGNMVLKQVGGPAGLTRYFRSLKDPVSRLDRWETELNDWTAKERRDTTTPAAISRDLRLLTWGDALNAQDRRRLNGWLRANQTGDARIRAGLPKSWTIGDKTGTNAEIGGANDIAVIWPDKGSAPIIMAVYTTRSTPSVDDKVLAKTATVLARGLGKL
ncbi:Beta-lactamase FAR-1 precursor [Nonomuraea coxensis DSM 45129]|uniref:Beta-lactamase FAR-1 n=1 Tax=Nonomuraea coxensis DSM 45129 TaxID=1122611 RepID=A0ABX8U9D2_9ACTN|nr:class A beta-lactamase [Nonomuraea coxensis]QYC43464.1 Beta-lactamase FAR-1 precursor [Nonomuraea coxensis DSM 45129]